MASTVWKGHLTFGLVSIPVRLYRAARAEKVRLREVYRRPAPEPAPDKGRVVPFPTNSTRPKLSKEEPIEADLPAPAMVERVRRAPVLPSDDEFLEPSEVVKGYEYSKDQYVLLEPASLKSIEAATSTEMRIIEFVRLSEIDPLYFESSYYAAPDRGGDRPYALLFEALRRSGYVGIAEVAMHRREHITVVRPGPRGILVHTMFYTNELHAEDEYTTDTAEVNQRELQLAEKLIGNLAVAFDPSQYRDAYRERLEQLIAARMEGHEVAEAAKPSQARPVADIMEALQRSLEATAPRKPAAPEPSRSRHKPAPRRTQR